MRVLVIAPQPFYQERGTPIAVRLAVEALSRQLPLIDGERCKIDLLVYNEGSDIAIPGVNLIRARIPRWLSGVRPGISCKKLLCDLFLFIHALRLLITSRHQRYDVIHAVEESVFFAWLTKKIFGIPYVYDMDSSLALQVTERWWWCKPALALLQKIEGIAVRGSVAVAPVCEELQAIAERHGSAATVLLRDVSLLAPENQVAGNQVRSLLYNPAITGENLVILYVGNLESYQGIDLLIESFALIHREYIEARLVIIGGASQHVAFYKDRCLALGCESSVFFLGPRPVQHLGQLLKSADILVSPRIKGNNTPMKIYSYLHSGTVLVATDLPTHSQVLDHSIALLVEPEPKAFSAGLSKLISDTTLRDRLGKEAQKVAEQLYTPEAFETQVGALYRLVSGRINTNISRNSANICGNL
jgi:glycosyltransferase involved in cell wall biosynthesis